MIYYNTNFKKRVENVFLIKKREFYDFDNITEKIGPTVHFWLNSC